MSFSYFIMRKLNYNLDLMFAFLAYFFKVKRKLMLELIDSNKLCAFVELGMLLPCRTIKDLLVLVRLTRLDDVIRWF